VAGLAVETIIWGTATKVLVRAAYDTENSGADAGAGVGADGPPVALCVKGGFDPALRGLAMASAYRREAAFYGRIAPDIAVPMPRCWYAGANLEQGQGIVLLDDLAAAGARFGEPTRPWTADQVNAGLHILARLHAATWDCFGRYPWLPRTSPVQEVGQVLLGSEYWDQHFAADHAPPLPAQLLDRPRMLAALNALWALDREQAASVSHGDPHIGNTYFAADGRPGFLDWQGMCAAPAMDDVSYFVSGALPVAQRRAHERALVEDYLAALAGYGGPAYGFDEAWLSYRQHQLHGFLWAVTGPHMQPAERVAAMTERHVAAIVDHQSLDTL
jgi:hypothetical protein